MNCSQGPEVHELFKSTKAGCSRRVGWESRGDEERGDQCSIDQGHGVLSVR